jgi:hypothetical protein
MTRHFYIHYTLDTEDSNIEEDFFKYLTSVDAVNSFIAAEANGESVTANLPIGSLVVWFPSEYDPPMVYEYFQNCASSAGVTFQDLVAIEMRHQHSIYLGRLLP